MKTDIKCRWFGHFCIQFLYEKGKTIFARLVCINLLTKIYVTFTYEHTRLLKRCKWINSDVVNRLTNWRDRYRDSTIFASGGSLEALSEIWFNPTVILHYVYSLGWRNLWTNPYSEMFFFCASLVSGYWLASFIKPWVMVV